MLTSTSEYYFSVDNLLKDMFLRRRMDSQGFVSLEFIAGFNRIKHLSTDLELIKLVCQQSSVVQYRTGEDGQDRLRSLTWLIVTPWHKTTDPRSFVSLQSPSPPTALIKPSILSGLCLLSSPQATLPTSLRSRR
jgi:hypothetical protein